MIPRHPPNFLQHSRAHEAFQICRRPRTRMIVRASRRSWRHRDSHTIDTERRGRRACARVARASPSSSSLSELLEPVEAYRRACDNTQIQEHTCFDIHRPSRWCPYRESSRGRGDASESEPLPEVHGGYRELQRETWFCKKNTGREGT